MEQALYDREHGYYASGRAHIGKAGDFFTNVSVGKIYGKILTLFFEELWEKMGKPNPFIIVEQGANDGRLALDVLESAETSTDFFTAIHYYIVEPFSVYQKKQQETLKHRSNIFWVEKIEDLSAFEGIHFSNELIDTFPVHLLMWNGKEWMERRVGTSTKKSGIDSYGWITSPIEQEELRAVAAKLPTTLTPGFLWEVRLGVSSWLHEIETRMKRGMILIADYGYAGPQRFAPYRAKGSIACYQNHHRYNNPLEEVGKRDITAHVDFTDLAERAIQQHFEILGYSDQHHFLIGSAEAWLRSYEHEVKRGQSYSLLQKGSVHYISQKSSCNGMTPNVINCRTDLLADPLALQTLLHPESMGRAFQFLGLGKKLNFTSPLNGFRYQRPGVNYLFDSQA